MLAVLVAVTALPASSAAPAVAQESRGEEVIVVLDDGADPVAAAREMGVEVTHIYRHVFTGFAGVLPAGAVAEARRTRSARDIFPDGEVRIEQQQIATGVRRAGVPHRSGSSHLAIPSPIDADIAIVDTGVKRSRDLNVAGGVSCIDAKAENVAGVKKKRKHKKKKRDRQNKKDKKKDRQNRQRKRKVWEDRNGHGTHTAGIAAATDNDRGVVGVAPGARIWAVKVIDASGIGSFSDVICGLDWIAKRSGTIDVANLSLSGPGQDGSCDSSALHTAVCNLVDKGVVVVVAAGNQSEDASNRVPASYDEVITVSALADSDGAPGKDGPRTCFGELDDTFWSFSNFGPDVDIMAPGDCILSLSLKGKPTRKSGTSQAAPHVSGAAAHFIARQIRISGDRPSPAETKTWLLTAASRSQAQDGVTGDPDAFPEPVLWLEILGTW
jgi:subtilisin family serine protease